jgi:hypothetical protein
MLTPSSTTLIGMVIFLVAELSRAQDQLNVFLGMMEMVRAIVRDVLSPDKKDDQPCLLIIMAQNCMMLRKYYTNHCRIYL